MNESSPIFLPQNLIILFRKHLGLIRDTSIRVLGFWWWWLFVVPSLRSRRPKGPEKKALDVAFLGTPLVSLIAPIATKDTGWIWGANFLVVAGSYAFAFLLDTSSTAEDDEEGMVMMDGIETKSNNNVPEWLKFVFKSLDFGTGRERGSRK
jgi:hypothetical protein